MSGKDKITTCFLEHHTDGDMGSRDLLKFMANAWNIRIETRGLLTMTYPLRPGFDIMGLQDN